MAFSNLYSGYVRSTGNREDAAVKRYESVEDTRAYALKKSERSQFLYDVVNSPPEDSSSDDSENLKKMDIKALTNEELVGKIKSLYEDIKVGSSESGVLSTEIAKFFLLPETRRRAR